MRFLHYAAGSSEGHSPVLNLSKTGGDHSGPASDHSAGGNTNVDDEDDLDEDDDNISDGEEDDIKDHGINYFYYYFYIGTYELMILDGKKYHFFLNSIHFILQL